MEKIKGDKLERGRGLEYPYSDPSSTLIPGPIGAYLA